MHRVCGGWHVLFLPAACITAAMMLMLTTKGVLLRRLLLLMQSHARHLILQWNRFEDKVLSLCVLRIERRDDCRSVADVVTRYFAERVTRFRCLRT